MVLETPDNEHVQEHVNVFLTAIVVPRIELLSNYGDWCEYRERKVGFLHKCI